MTTAPAPGSNTAQAPANESQASAPAPVDRAAAAPTAPGSGASALTLEGGSGAAPAPAPATPPKPAVPAPAAKDAAPSPAAPKPAAPSPAAPKPAAATVAAPKPAAQSPAAPKPAAPAPAASNPAQAKAPTPQPAAPKPPAPEPDTAKSATPEAAPVPLPVPARPPAPPKTWFQRINKIFLATVVVPTLLVALYFGFMASDVYISESRFVVRNPQRPNVTEFGALLAGAGFSRPQDDNYTVQSYVLSRDALRELEEKLKVREAYSSGNIDLFSRFPGLDWDESFEALFEHYMGHVTIAYDSASSITTLEVRAYTPEMSRAINEMLLQMSERLVNNLNDRSRQDLIAVAQREVKEAEKRARDAALALADFRSKRGIFDPAKEAGMLIDNAARLREDLRVTETQIAQLKQLAPANPQIATLGQQAARLRSAIAEENAKTLGPNNSLNAKSIAYERLALEKQFSDQELAATLANLEVARNDAARKQLYLERLVQPNLPDTALEPRRIRSVFTVFVVGLLVWGVVSLLVAGVREHAD